MAKTVQQLNPEVINADPWGALYILYADNPIAIAEAFSTVAGYDVAPNPNELVQFTKTWLAKQGNIYDLVAATEGIDIQTDGPKSVNWAGIVAGVGSVLTTIGTAIGGGNNNANAEEVAAAAAAAQKRTINTILIVVAIVGAIVLAVIYIKRKK